MLTITTAYEITAEMMGRLPKPALVALVESISGNAWADEADNAHHHIAGLLLESAGLSVVRDSQNGEVLSARGA
jgi:hypothetical protein